MSKVQTDLPYEKLPATMADGGGYDPSRDARAGGNGATPGPCPTCKAPGMAREGFFFCSACGAPVAPSAKQEAAKQHVGILNASIKRRVREAAAELGRPLTAVEHQEALRKAHHDVMTEEEARLGRLPATTAFAQAAGAVVKQGARMSKLERLARMLVTKSAGTIKLADAVDQILKDLKSDDPALAREAWEEHRRLSEVPVE